MQKINYSESDIRKMIGSCVGTERVPKKIEFITDTSDFFRVDFDTIVILDGSPYLIRNYEKEGRFGIDDEPKFWVKRAVDLTSCDLKIIKMVFHESFKSRVGSIEYECVRSFTKEARILDKVRGHQNFMQGFSTTDSAGNLVRIVDYIKGKTLASHISDLGENHEDYFHNYFPSVFNEFIELVSAIEFLHSVDEIHGDIRRDHVIRDKDIDIYRWIDFDYNFKYRANKFAYDLFGLGNILVFITAQGDITLHDLKHKNSPVLEGLTEADFNIIYHNRLVNLKKIYPYMYDSLNFILLHFSNGANIFYEDVTQLLLDLKEVREIIV